MIFRLLAVTLLDLPEAVIVPGQNMIRVRFERALIPGLGELVVAKLAIGIADQVGDVGVVVLAERLELFDRRSVVVTVVDGRIGRAIALNESGITEEGLLRRLLAPVGGRSVLRRLRL